MDFEKLLNPRKFAKTTADLPWWYKCLVPHDGKLPDLVVEKTINLPGEDGKFFEQKVVVKFFHYQGRR